MNWSKLQRMNIRKFLFLFLVFILWASIVLQQACTSSESPNSELADPVSMISENNQYIGDKSCSSCHEEEYNKWKDSHHFHSMEVADQNTVLGNFNNITVYLNGVESRFFMKNENYYVNTQGPDGNLQDYKIEYTFGYQPLQQYLVKFPGGRLQTLHLCWDTEEKKWFDLFPDEDPPIDDWMHWTKGSMTWNSMCAECHSTDLKKNYAFEEDTFNTTWSSINVSCETCHGPGQKHVEWVNAGNEYTPDKIKEHLYATTGSPPIEQIENCAPCHSRRSEITLDYTHGERFLDQYMPPFLSEGLYHADGQIDDEVYVYGSFIQSKMFQNGVKCSDCHDPHTLNLISIDNALCNRCHEPKKYDTEEHHFHALNTEASKCINCHMTGKYYMVNDYRRDHSFRIPRPDQSVLYNTPNACNDCHSDKTASWAAKEVTKWYGNERPYHFSDDLVYGRTLDSTSAKRLAKLINDMTQPAIARATAIEYLSRIQDSISYPTIVKSLKDRDPIVRISALQAITILPPEQKLPLASNLLNDNFRGVRVSAANTLADVPNQNLTPSGQKAKVNAEDEFLELLQAQADLPGGRMTAGQFYDRKGLNAKAEKEYLKADEMDPYLTPNKENLALLYNRTGRNNLAIKEYQEILDIEPENGRVYYYLGLIFAEEGDYENSINSLVQAQKFSPGNERIYYNLGIIYQTIGNRSDAEKTYLNGLKVFPNSVDLNYAIAVLYAQEGRVREAQPFIRFLKSIDPDNPQLQSLYNLAGSD